MSSSRREQGRALRATARMSAGVADAGDVGRVQDFVDRALLRRAEHHGLGPALHVALRDADGIAPCLREDLRGAYHRAVRTHLLAVESLRFLHDAWGETTPWFVVKGPVLSERLYPRPDLRSYVDLDVVVPPAAFGRALGEAERAGARLVDRNWQRLVDERPGELRLELPTGLLVDLHWHLLGRPAHRAAFPLDATSLLERTHVVDVGGVSVRTPDPVHTAIHLGLHACLAGGDRLVWLVDLHHAISAVDDLDALVRSTRRTGTSLPLRIMVDRAARTLGVGALRVVAEALAPRGAWQTFACSVDRLTRLERSSGGPSLRRIVTRATRTDDRSSFGELHRRGRLRMAQPVGAPRPRPSIRLDAGGADARQDFLEDVVGEPDVPQTATTGRETRCSRFSAATPGSPTSSSQQRAARPALDASETEVTGSR